MEHHSANLLDRVVWPENIAVSSLDFQGHK
jgi:hypothetical protein